MIAPWRGVAVVVSKKKERLISGFAFPTKSSKCCHSKKHFDSRRGRNRRGRAVSENKCAPNNSLSDR